MNVKSRGENSIDKLLYLAATTRRYMSKAMPGMLARVEWHFYRVHNRDFIRYFLEEPLKAYESLLNLYGDTEEGRKTAEHLVYFLLKGIFMNNLLYAEQSHKAILRRDREGFKKILDNYLKTLR